MNEIQHVLRLFPPDCQPARIESLGSAGGKSGAQFWRITVVRGSPDPTQARGTLILRRWPTEHPTPERLRFIHAVLCHAAEHGITFLPVPIRTATVQSFVHHAGHLWELAPWMPGTADYERSPRVEKLRAALTALAEFHIAVADFALAATQRVAGASPAVTRRLARLRELQTGGTDALAHAIADTTWSELAPLARQFVAALPRAVPKAIAQLEPLAGVPLPLQPCLRDIWHDHVLFAGDEVTGFIDFGAIGIDTPAGDIARLLGSLGTVPFSQAHIDRSQSPNDGEQGETAKRGLSPSPRDRAETWREGLAAYAAIRSLSPHELRAVVALDTSGTILAGCNWIRWIYLEGRKFENRQQVIERFRRLLARCEGLKVFAT